MQKNSIWLPLIASVGVGAATFYTMTQNNMSIGQTMEKVMPMLSGGSSGSSGGSGHSGS